MLDFRCFIAPDGSHFQIGSVWNFFRTLTGIMEEKAGYKPISRPRTALSSRAPCLRHQERGYKMKKLFLTIGMLITSIALYGMAAQAGTFPVTKVIEVPGATKEQVMDKVSAWAGSYGKASKVDAKTGSITATGEIAYPSPPLDRIQHTIAFEMKNTVQGNKDIVTFDKVMLKSPIEYLEYGRTSGGQTSPLKTEKDIAAATSRLAYIADNLEAYLLGKGTESCPLVKCPDCAVLCPTSEEMKEHMKTHEHMKGRPGQETAPKY